MKTIIISYNYKERCYELDIYENEKFMYCKKVEKSDEIKKIVDDFYWTMGE